MACFSWFFIVFWWFFDGFWWFLHGFWCFLDCFLMWKTPGPHRRRPGRPGGGAAGLRQRPGDHGGRGRLATGAGAAGSFLDQQTVRLEKRPTLETWDSKITVEFWKKRPEFWKTFITVEFWRWYISCHLQNDCDWNRPGDPTRIVVPSLQPLS